MLFVATRSRCWVWVGACQARQGEVRTRRAKPLRTVSTYAVDTSRNDTYHGEPRDSFSSVLLGITTTLHGMFAQGHQRNQLGEQWTRRYISDQIKVRSAELLDVNEDIAERHKTLLRSEETPSF